MKLSRLKLSHDLGLQLLTFYVLFVAPVVLAALAFDYYAGQRLVADVKASDLALARAIAQETNTTLQNAMQAVQSLSTYPEVLAADPEGMNDLFHAVLSTRPDLNLIYRLDTAGIMLFHYPLSLESSTVGDDFSFRDYFERAQSSMMPLVSKGRISPTTGQPVATAVMPLWIDGQFSGLVATNIKLQSLSHALSRIAAEYPPSQRFRIMIVDSSGQVIAHQDPGQLLIDLTEDLPQVSQAALSTNSGNTIAPDERGEETLFSYMPITSTGWGVIVSRPTATAFATPTALHRGILFTISVFLIIGLFFWLALARRVLQPLERLAALSQAIGLEEISLEQRKTLDKLAARPDQMGRLINSLQRMEQAIQSRLNELSTLLETSAAVVSSLDSPIVLNRILEQVERLLNVDKSAIVALDEAGGAFRARASRGLSKHYTEQMSIDPSEPGSVTMRSIRAHQPIQVSDVETDPTFAPLRPRAMAEGYRSILAIPLNTVHAFPHVLLVYRQDAHVFSSNEIDLLSSFANHAAMAIENATLFQRSDMRLQEQTRRLEALIQSQVDGLLLEDLNGHVLYANRRISELSGIDPAEINRTAASELLDRIIGNARNPEETRQQVRMVIEGRERRTADLALPGRLPGGRTQHLRLQVFDVTDNRNLPIGRGQIWHDITADRELDAMKTSLISTVSHELRTPLASIKGYATTLLAEDVQWDTQAQREFLQIISQETDRLSELVNDLLDLSRIEAGNLSVNRSQCSLAEVIERAAGRARPRPGARLQLDMPPSLPPVFADPRRIEVVLRNLIENAAKYSPPDTPITVNVELQDDRLLVKVADQGPGIPEEHRQRVFESFYRVESGRMRSVSGAGLGLAISQGFVRAHGGQIWLEPAARGTTIAFSLPLELAETTAVQEKETLPA